MCRVQPPPCSPFAPPTMLFCPFRGVTPLCRLFSYCSLGCGAQPHPGYATKEDAGVPGGRVQRRLAALSRLRRPELPQGTLPGGGGGVRQAPRPNHGPGPPTAALHGLRKAALARGPLCARQAPRTAALVLTLTAALKPSIRPPTPGALPAGLLPQPDRIPSASYRRKKEPAYTLL